MASTAHLLRFSPHPNHHHPNHTTFSVNPRLSTPPPSISFPFSSSDSRFPTNLQLAFSGGDGSSGIGHGGSGSGGGHGGSGGWSDGSGEGDSSSSAIGGLGPLGLFLNGWRSRVAADPQFPFKVLMEELVGVTACVIGDMASRPNFGLNELDFVFSTLVVGSILNFTLMYLLAPTLSSSPSNLPAIFANCPKSHMFEPGSFTLAHRLGTLVFKGTVFAAVGFAAGLVGTAISNGLMRLNRIVIGNLRRKRLKREKVRRSLTLDATDLLRPRRHGSPRDRRPDLCRVANIALAEICKERNRNARSVESHHDREERNHDARSVESC